MENTLIADTGYLLALANSQDQHHKHCVEVSKTLTGNLITTWPVITETSYFIMKFVSRTAQLKLIDKLIKNHILLWHIPADTISLIKNLSEKYIDLPMDIADASLVVLAEELGHGNILSTDRRDFQTYRWKNHKPFHNLLFPND